MPLKRVNQFIPNKMYLAQNISWLCPHPTHTHIIRPQQEQAVDRKELNAAIHTTLPDSPHDKDSREWQMWNVTASRAIPFNPWPSCSGINNSTSTYLTNWWLLRRAGAGAKRRIGAKPPARTAISKINSMMDLCVHFVSPEKLKKRSGRKFWMATQKPPNLQSRS